MKKTAFSLIEMSVVLVILAILVIGGLSVSATKIRNAKIKLTQQRIDAIYQAIGRYALRFGSLPCPASLALSKQDSDYGKENRVVSACQITGGYVSANQLQIGNNYLIFGMVPIKALNLPKEAAEDGFGNKLIYIIPHSMAQKDAYLTGAGSFDYGPATHYQFAKILEMPSQNLIEDVALVIISHGENRNGAFEANSTSRNPISSDAYEQANSIHSILYDNNAFFGYNDSDRSQGKIKFVISPESATFDDIVFFKKRNDLIIDFNAHSLVKCNEESGYSIAAYGATRNRDTACSWPYDAITPSKKCGPFGQWFDIQKCP